MRSFFKYVLATITGIILLTVIWIVLLIAIVGSLGKEKDVFVAQNSVLHITFNHEITERTIPNPLEGLDVPGFLSTTTSLGLDDIIQRLRAAATDDRIKGIYLDLSAVSASFATLQEIRDELLTFKESEKFIVAYSESFTQRAYFLASVADKVFLNPEGALQFNGLSSQIMFLKGALDKLGVDMQVIKVGTYKSAVEPFILEQMSDENREQVTSFIGNIYDHFLEDIADSRGIHRDTLFAIADEMRVETPEDAVAFNLVDELMYKDELLGELRSLLGITEDKDIRSVSLTKYKPDSPTATSSRDRVAVVYALGDIVSGEGSDSQIGSERISRELRRIRKDERVKAVVLRVNSPGGSALASDVIWREVDLLREEKPIIVSMGDVAASGGYYISAAADSIFAQPNTITGSIGVFGLVPNMQELMNNKLGISFDQVKTGQHADFLMNMDRPLTGEEEAILQRSVNRVYDTFMKRVADGRDISVQQVDSIGQGRVWTGQQALEIGLVDRLASLDEAIKTAADMARLEDYRIVKYPALKQPFESIMGTSAERISSWFVKNELKQHYTIYEQMKSVMSNSGIQARIPYTFEIY